MHIKNALAAYNLEIPNIPSKKKTKENSKMNKNFRFPNVLFSLRKLIEAKN